MGGSGFEEAAQGFRSHHQALTSGALNLLVACAGLQPGHRVVILHEDPALGWYDKAAPVAVAVAARDRGATVTMAQVGGPDTSMPPEAARAIETADIEIWFARIGDQDRFAARDTRRIKVVSYARTAQALASSFGTAPHRDMVALKTQIDRVVSGAKHVQVTCPLGTDLVGSEQGQDPVDVSVRRFPMCVARPILAEGFSGRVALAGYLCPTGSRRYEPSCLALDTMVMAEIERGRIRAFDGSPNDVAAVSAHYARVSELFGIDPSVVHSFHAGIHGGCAFDGTAEGDADLWANSIFGSPHWLHFHTCGDYAPGEICWMVARPTITVDGRALWSDGRVLPLEL